MRKFKFRAWDEKRKEMFVVNSSYRPKGVKKDCFFIGFNGTGLEVSEYEGKGVWRRFPLMQYTGLKDSKGTEIYEGDLIKTKEYIWLVEPIGSKERDGSCYGLCVSPFGNGEMWFIDESILKGEVIGNIYANPELLEETK
jgi:uncharacterized phage protein (TIGR01671 family)